MGLRREDGKKKKRSNKAKTKIFLHEPTPEAEGDPGGSGREENRKKA